MKIGKDIFTEVILLEAGAEKFEDISFLPY